MIKYINIVKYKWYVPITLILYIEVKTFGDAGKLGNITRNATLSLQSLAAC
jgi:hypothetical protein